MDNKYKGTKTEENLKKAFAVLSAFRFFTENALLPTAAKMVKKS